MRSDPVVRRVGGADGALVRDLMTQAWGSLVVARRGEAVDVTGLPGFVARLDGADVGLALVAVRDDDYEVVAISTRVEGRGVGRALLARCVDDAREQGCRRLWLCTTNDNVRALASTSATVWTCAPSGATGSPSPGGSSRPSRCTTGPVCRSLTSWSWSCCSGRRHEGRAGTVG